MALSFCLAAPQLLPTLEYTAHSQRATAVSRDLAMTYSFWPWRLSGLLAPNLFGSPVTGDYWGYGNFWEDAIYVGVIPLCLALAAIFQGLRGRGRQPGLVRLLAGIGLFSWVIALGKNTPFFPFLYDHVPTFSLFQAPTRWNLWLVFAFSLLAGIGIDAWGVARGRALYWLRLGTAGAVAVALGAGVASVALKDVHPTFITATAVSGVWLAAAGILALTVRDAPGRIWKAGVIGVVVVDLTLVRGRAQSVRLALPVCAGVRLARAAAEWQPPLHEPPGGVSVQVRDGVSFRYLYANRGFSPRLG